MEAKTASDTLSIVLAQQSDDYNVGAEGQAMNNDFALDSGQSAVLLSPSRVPAYDIAQPCLCPFPLEG
jgi:hypothetical protein